MALKHYGGTVPTAATSWTCPSCGAENQVPFKAGCQQCGAGADAKRVTGALEIPTPQPIAAPVHLPNVAVVTAALDWMASRDFPLEQETPWATSEDVQEAFRAGATWAKRHAPLVRDAVHLHDPGPVAVTQPVTGKEYLYMTVQQAIPDHSVDSAVEATILAALAFYRDNQLAYGPVPGQLTAEQVDALIARLSPPPSPESPEPPTL